MVHSMSAVIYLAVGQLTSDFFAVMGRASALHIKTSSIKTRPGKCDREHNPHFRKNAIKGKTKQNRQTPPGQSARPAVLS